jgi:hypothetical protein
VIELEYDINSVNEFQKPPQTAEKARYFPVKVDRKGLIGRNKRPTAYPNSIDLLEVAGFVLATLISKGAWPCMVNDVEGSLLHPKAESPQLGLFASFGCKLEIVNTYLVASQQPFSSQLRLWVRKRNDDSVVNKRVCHHQSH